jgi:glycosyltransferase involved in cell wall biosynthesis
MTESLFGVVVVGRNEGNRLPRSLISVLACTRTVIYVDSGSSDDSVSLAESLGVAVWPLDPARPFSAARARNEGFERLVATHPGLEAVQFVDGDCELDPAWLAAGLAELRCASETAMVCGHIRERDPAASPYNRMCALEWRQVPGNVSACGGNFMVRATVFAQLGGFRCEVTAGEEDEFCQRVLGLGYKIHLLGHDMVLHDSALLHFSQWWKRARRCGHAYAQGRFLHREDPAGRFRRELRSLIVWGAVVPLSAILPAAATGGASLLILGSYAVLAERVYRHCHRRGWSADEARLYATFTVLSKLPGLLGLIQFNLDRWRGRHPALIEHKQLPRKLPHHHNDINDDYPPSPMRDKRHA